MPRNNENFFSLPSLPSMQPVGARIDALQQEMNRLFERFYSGMQVHLTDWDALPSSAPAINVSETQTAFSIEVALPGIDLKDIKVETTGNVLTISGEHKEEKSEKNTGSYLCKEIFYGSFVRSTTLPSTAEAGKAAAQFRNGILTVTVPKKAEAIAQPRKIDIKQAA